MTATEIAVVGLGKIARDQHLPSIAASGAFRLAATVSRNATEEGVPSYRDLPGMLAAMPEVAAVALCVPPQVRFAMAKRALEAGRDVLLEKPPGATLSEVETLSAIAQGHGRVLFATWHSRFAAGVPAAKAWLADKALREVTITWHEDVRHWHPGQDWIWEAGGFGVFDPGINALSILTEILPGPVRLISAEMEFPSNRQTPIAATLEMAAGAGAPIAASFDWRRTGRQLWEIEVATEAGRLFLSDGGARVSAGGEALAAGNDRLSEYDGLYARFADLLARRESDVDVAPLRLVADAFLTGRHMDTDPFHD